LAEREFSGLLTVELTRRAASEKKKTLEVLGLEEEVAKERIDPELSWS
jgi:hypothetical protein